MKQLILLSLVLTAVFLGYQQVRGTDDNMEKPMEKMAEQPRSAVFAGGCFWCTESDFEKLDGVIAVVSGYTGGQVAEPSYEAGLGRRHRPRRGRQGSPTIRTEFHTKRCWTISGVMWIPPMPAASSWTVADQYRSAIFYANEAERKTAEASKKALAASGQFDRPIVTDILPLGTFLRSRTDYHQDYYKKNPLRYKWYRSGSGRDRFLENSLGRGPA